MMALDDEGNVWSWGRNNSGQLGLGDGMSGTYGKPQPLPNLTSIVSLAAGRQHSLALSEKGEVFAWGCGRDGALGLGDKSARKSPTKVEELEDVVAIACGRGSSFALTKDGEVYSWGRDEYGELAQGRSQRFVTRPKIVSGLRNIKSISVGEYHGVAISEDGKIFSFGKNTDGQCGNGNRNNVSQPMEIETFEAMDVSVVSASCGDGHTAAITSDGNLWAWGRGRSGELGRGAETESNAAYRAYPVKVPLPAGKVATEVALGAEHSLCLVEE
jgi:alpha-tubulin suppressor-like RCC1 family protein